MCVFVRLMSRCCAAFDTADLPGNWGTDLEAFMSRFLHFSSAWLDRSSCAARYSKNSFDHFREVCGAG